MYFCKKSRLYYPKYGTNPPILHSFLSILHILLFFHDNIFITFVASVTFQNWFPPAFIRELSRIRNPARICKPARAAKTDWIPKSDRVAKPD